MTGIVITFPSGDIQADYTLSSLSLNEIFFNKLKPVDNTCKLTAVFSIELANALKLYAENDNLCKVYNENEECIFTGYLRKSFSFTKTQRNQPISLEIVSPSYLLDKEVTTEIFRTNETVGSIVNELASQADFTINCTLSEEVAYFKAEEGDNIYDTIQELLFEYGYTFDFDKDGEFVVYELFASSKTTAHTFNGANCLTEIQVKRSEKAYTGVTASWVEKEYVKDVLLYEDTDGASTAGPCSIDVEPGSYMYGDDNTEGIHYLEYDCTKGEVLHCSSIEPVVSGTYISQLQTEYANNGTSLKWKCYNPSMSVTATYTKFQWWGNAWVQKATNETKTTVTGDKSLELKLSYLNDLTSVTALIQNVADYYRKALFTITLKSKDNVELGSFVTVTEYGIGTITGRVIQKQKTRTDVYTYIIESVSAYTPATVDDTKSYISRKASDDFSSQVAELNDKTEDLQEQINNIEYSGTTCQLDVGSISLEVDDEGCTQTVQTFTTHVTLQRSEDKLDWILKDGWEDNLPEGFTAVRDGDAITFTVGEGINIKSGFIKIPVIYTQILSDEPFIDEDGNIFIDEDGNEFLDVVYGSSGTEWDLYLNYVGTGYGRFLGTFTTLAQISASNPNVSDYFVWGGTDELESTMAYEGFFRQAQTYKYIGTGKTWTWEEDTNSGHMQAALSDVLAISNADLEKNNSTVWEYLDHLTANSVYCDMLVANEAFIEKLGAKIITADLVTTDQLESASINLDAYNFASKDSVTNIGKTVKSVRTLFYKTTSTSAPSAPTSSSQIVDTNTTGAWTSYQVTIADGYYIYACTEETYYDNTVGWTDVYTHTKTIISGGYIRTGLIHADEVTASCVKTSELTNGNVDLSKYDYATTTAAKGYASAAEQNAKDAIPNVKNLVKSVTTLYYKTALGNASPSKPTSTSQIVDTNINDTWTSYVVEFDAAYNIFCCTQETTYDNTVSWTDVYTAVSTIIKDGYIRTGALSADVLTSENISTKSLNVKGMITQGLKSFAMMELCFGYDATNHMMAFSSNFFRITGAISGKSSEGKYYYSDTYGNVITRIDKGIFKFQLKDTYTKSKFPAIWEDDDWDVIQLIPLIRFSSNYTVTNDGITYANCQNALNAKIKKGCSRSVYGGTFTELEEAVLEPLYQGTPPYISFTGLQKSSWYHDTTNGYYEFYLIITDMDAGTFADPSGTIDFDIHAYFF